MKCARCSAEVPAQSQFCLRCGSPIHTTAAHTGPMPGGSRGVGPRPNQPMIMLAALLGLAVVGLAAFIIHGYLTQKPSNSVTGQLVQAPASSIPGAPVQAPADPQPARIVQAPAPAAIDTTDISDYLKFLKRVEYSKQELIRRADSQLKVQVAMSLPNEAKQFFNGIDDGSPAGDPKMGNAPGIDVGKLASGLEAGFNILSSTVRQHQTPPACIALRDAYMNHLGKIQGRTIQISTIMAEVSTNPQDALTKLENMRNQNGDLENDSRNADAVLEDVTTKYHLTKDFDIKGDESSFGSAGSSPLLGK